MKWILQNADPKCNSGVATELRSCAAFRTQTNPTTISTLAHLLHRRGITDIESATRFLTPSLSHLHPPEQMTGIPAAVDRVDAAIERKEPTLIYGDYDVDGTMAAILL